MEVTLAVENVCLHLLPIRFILEIVNVDKMAFFETLDHGDSGLHEEPDLLSDRR